MKVTVYSTVGKKATVLENLAVETWGDLKKALREMNIQYNGMKAVIGETRNTLESDKALLLQEDFSLFLMPVKTKSGADRKELFAQYKASNAAQEHFKNKGLQITRMKTPDIEAELAKFIGKSVSSAKEAGKKAAEEAVKKMSEKTVKEEKAAEKKVVEPEVEAEFVPHPENVKKRTIELYTAKFQAIKAIVSKAVDDGDLADEIGEQIDDLADDGIEFVKGGDRVIIEIMIAEEKAKLKAIEEEKLRKEAEKKMEKELESKAYDIAKDFSDLKSF